MATQHALQKPRTTSTTPNVCNIPPYPRLPLAHHPLHLYEQFMLILARPPLPCIAPDEPPPDPARVAVNKRLDEWVPQSRLEEAPAASLPMSLTLSPHPTGMLSLSSTPVGYIAGARLSVSCPGSLPIRMQTRDGCTALRLNARTGKHVAGPHQTLSVQYRRC